MTVEENSLAGVDNGSDSALIGEDAASDGPNMDVTHVETYVNLPEIVSEEESRATPFVPSLGAWATPLKISSDTTPLASTTFPETASNLLNELSSPSQWPSIAVGSQVPSKRVKQLRETHKNRAQPPTKTKIPVQASYTPSLREDGNFRFPWAAKMQQSSRNLYRATTPTYMEDGTPKVTIPRHVLLHGPENRKEYVIGQFFHCSLPSGGLVNAVVNRIWGRKCKIFSRKLGESSFLFHIPDESTRSWVLQRGLWHVDDCMMFIAPWSPAATLSLPEISTVPVWVTLKNIPECLYSKLGISHIGSGLGEPILTNKPWLDPTLMGEAKIMVEVELDKPFPQRIALDDEMGTIYMVDVEYSWIPTKCGRCGHLGHKESRCLQKIPTEFKAPMPASVATVSTTAPATTGSPDFVIPATEQGPLITNLTTIEEVDTLHNSDSTAWETTTIAPIIELDSTIDSTSTISVVADLATTNTITSVGTEPTSIADSAKLCSEISADIEATLDTIFPTNSVSTETAHFTTNITSSPSGFPAAGNTFSTPTSQAKPSSQENEDVESSVFEYNHSTAFESGVLTGFESNHDFNQRTRGGRHIKPTQKVQEMQWTTVNGRGNRGRGGRGGRGS